MGERHLRPKGVAPVLARRGRRWLGLRVGETDRASVDALGLLFLVLAALAPAIPMVVERIRRPRIEIDARPWTPSNPLPWTFAVVNVRGRPLPRLLAWLVRHVAAGCTVTLECRRCGEGSFPEVPGHWSSRLDPLKIEPVVPDGPDSPATPASASSSGAAQAQWVFDPSMIPQTLTLDLAPGRWEQLAVSVLRHGGDAYAWGAESYAYPSVASPAWKLERGAYEVTVRVESSGIVATRVFKLDSLGGDFARFRFTPL